MIYLFICLIALVGLLQAQIPETLSYQGTLLNESGQPVANGDYAMTFRIYEVSSGGTAIWEESQSIPVADGIFSAVLGSSNPLNIPFDRPYWLGVTIAGEPEMQMRIELTSSGYSLNTRQVKGESNIFTGNGNVGVGTTNPQEKLEVAGTIRSTSGGFKFPDGSIQTTAATGNVSGDNLGNHTATQDLNLNGNNLINGNIINGQNLNIQSVTNLSEVSGIDLNLQSSRNMELASGQDLNIQGQRNMGLVSGQDLSMLSVNKLSLASGQDMNMQSDLNVGIISGKDVNIDVGSNLTLDAADQITIKCGDASITLTKDGAITIKGLNILIEAYNHVVIKEGGTEILKK
jgi:Uncharacterized protein conserved in bacteria (DUF2345)